MDLTPHTRLDWDLRGIMAQKMWCPKCQTNQSIRVEGYFGIMGEFKSIYCEKCGQILEVVYPPKREVSDAK